MFQVAQGLGLFNGYQLGEQGPSITHLQFADDTLIIGEKSNQNAWAIKSIMQLFELALGLKVNFHKSRLVGINVKLCWLIEASWMLNCKLGELPFMYLELSIGADPRRKSTWIPVVEKVRRRLSLWTTKHISLGGRVILLKPVLYSLPIYFLSFFKAPKSIISSLEALFKSFWWGAGLMGKKDSLGSMGGYL